VQQSLGQLFERWDGRGWPNGLAGDAIARPVRVVQVAQDAVVLHRLAGADAAVRALRERSGDAYDPDVAASLAGSAERLLGDFPRSAWTSVIEAEPGPRPTLADEALDRALRAIADFADLKSPYTSGHSSGVADLAARAAREARMPDADAADLHRAALVHDLGRTGIPNGICDRPGPLSDAEWERVRLHPYFVERMLARPATLARIGALAALHHERLDGSGYHRGARAAALPAGARILAAAGVYHALQEPRPHRPARVPAEAADVLRAEVRAGRLDGEAADLVLAAAGHRRRRRRDWPAGLTTREVEVLRLLARGLTNRQIAAELTISTRTAGHHVQHVYGKIGVSTRAAAALFAMQHDLVGGT
jgi:HD-GYP domain-containing protein (c-di-GMP phosphodiesterase class II)